MIAQYNTEERKERRSGKIGEDFTPDSITELLFENCEELYKDFSKTYLDPAGGNGNLLIWVFKHRMQYVKTAQDIIDALNSLYMVELFQNNVDECKDRIKAIIEETSNSLNVYCDFEEIKKILDFNIVCHDAFKWNYKEWKPIEEEKSIELF